MVIFSFEGYQSFEKVFLKSGHTQGKFTFSRYPNQEATIKLKNKVDNQDCLIIGSITPPDENLIATLLLAHTLKKEGSKMVTLLAPYLAYTRQDKSKPGESLATSLVGHLLKTAGVDQVLTVDVHSQQALQLFPIKITSYSPAHLFVQAINKLSWQDATLFAPDLGSIKRYQEIKSLARMTHPSSYLKKIRNQHNIIHQDISGQVTPRMIVVDDMLDTGATLVSCCQVLKDKGAKEIIIMVTHGLFTGRIWLKLWKLGVKKIYCTNTIPQLFPKKDIVVLDSSILFQP